MRLFQLDKDMENEGRVEYCSSGRWGLVCLDSWDANDARVICRQLGYNVESKITSYHDLCIIIICSPTDQSVAISRKDISVSPPPRDLPPRKVDCIGTEDSITQCTVRGFSDCQTPGAGVICPSGNNLLWH